jgi:hypothetical protein
MGTCVIFFLILSTLDSRGFFKNYQITHFFYFLGYFASISIEKLKKRFFGDFLKPAKNVRISVFVIFGHFQIAFSLIFLGVQTHVMPQKKVQACTLRGRLPIGAIWLTPKTKYRPG